MNRRKIEAIKVAVTAMLVHGGYTYAELIVALAELIAEWTRFSVEEDKE